MPVFRRKCRRGTGISMTRIILIADEDSSDRNILQRILEPEGYEVVQAESGEQVIALANTLQVDAFLLAIELPRMNHAVLCAEIRAIDRYRGAPIIFLTGSGDDAVLQEALGAGGDDFIKKPYTSVGVLARVKTHLQHVESLQRLE